jgi:hypothetical protein
MMRVCTGADFGAAAFDQWTRRGVNRLFEGAGVGEGPGDALGSAPAAAAGVGVGDALGVGEGDGPASSLDGTSSHPASAHT